MQFQHTYPRSIRFLAPAGGFSPLRDVRTALSELRANSNQGKAPQTSIKKQVENNLRLLLGTKHAFLTASGKEALYRLFAVLKAESKRDVILLSAYTCPDIATAAIKAGLMIYPVDIDAHTMEMNPSAVHVDKERVLAVVLSNLYGLTDSLDPWLRFAVDSGCDVIDDTCQSALSEVEGVSVGARAGTYGVVSFGRGKALPAIGGGAVLFNSGYDNSVLEKYTSYFDSISASDQLEQESVVKNFFDFLKVSFYYTFSNPFFYWIPASLPFLKLGQTSCELDFQSAPLGEVALGNIWAQLLRRKQRQIGALSMAKRYERIFTSLQVTQPFIERETRAREVVVPIRYPLILKSAEVRNKILPQLIAKGLGASGSYPNPLTGFKVLREKLLSVDCFVAEDISSRIITLPIHPYVREVDMTSAAKIIEKETARHA